MPFSCAVLTRLKEYMKLLAETGEYQISEDELSKIKGDFVAMHARMKRGQLLREKLFKDASYVTAGYTHRHRLGCIRQVFERWWATNKEWFYQPLHQVYGFSKPGTLRRSIRR